MKYEIRTLNIEARATKEENGERYLEGTPIVYNSESRLIAEGGKVFRELITPGALTETLQSEDLDVKAVWMHQRGQLLGTTKSGTVNLTESDEGVQMRLKVPNTTLGNDMYELVERGDITEMSFKFMIGDKENERWSENSTGEPLRTISKIDGLYDVSFVDEGAYGDTTVALRSLEEFENVRAEEDEEKTEMVEIDKTLLVSLIQQFNDLLEEAPVEEEEVEEEVPPTDEEMKILEHERDTDILELLKIKK